MQEESTARQEQARRATEEQIQALRRQTEKEKADNERETIKVRAMAEAEARAHEAKLSEEVNRRQLVDRANAEREKWVAAINTTFDHIGGFSWAQLFVYDHVMENYILLTILIKKKKISYLQLNCVIFCNTICLK